MPEPRVAPPISLRVAAGVVGLQGAVLAVLAVVELAYLTSGRVTMGLTTTAFLAVIGIALLVVAGGLLRAASWARSPAVLAQLLQLGVAWSFRGGGTGSFALLLVALSAAVLFGVLNPTSTEALIGRTGRDED